MFARVRGFFTESTKKYPENVCVKYMAKELGIEKMDKLFQMSLSLENAALNLRTKYESKWGNWDISPVNISEFVRARDLEEENVTLIFNLNRIAFGLSLLV